jgi:hypothetical protein
MNAKGNMYALAALKTQRATLAGEIVHRRHARRRAARPSGTDTV